MEVPQKIPYEIVPINKVVSIVQVEDSENNMQQTYHLE